MLATTKNYFIYLILFLIPSFCLANFIAPEGLEDKSKTNALQVQIDKVNEDIKKQRANLSKEQELLKDTEIKLGELAKKISTIKNEYSENQKAIAVLKENYDKLNATSLKQKEALKQQLKLNMLLNANNKFRVIFNQEDPKKINRMLTLNHYFNKNRVAKLKELNDNIESLYGYKNDIAIKNHKLDSLTIDLAKKQQEIKNEFTKRKNIIAKINANIKHEEEHLTSLQTSMKELNQVVNVIQTDLNNNFANNISFNELKGKLNWPLAGKFIAKFGESRGNYKQKWSGNLISGNLGDTVSAVHAGRVVFADWLRGYGLLVILDHGDGFMSLYGHNQSFYSKVGDFVQAGDPIATVGQSGGYSKSGLYFEIRKDGKPVDPNDWCNA